MKCPKLKVVGHTQSIIMVVMLALTSLAAEGQTPPQPAESTGTIRGRVLNESGQPLTNVSVTVRAFRSTGQNSVAITDQEGSFQVSGLAPVAYLISASSPAYTPMLRQLYSSQPTYYRIGDTVTLVLIKGGVITGTVTASTGEPIVGVRVSGQILKDANGQPSRYGPPIFERFTDDRGVYRIYGLPTGTYVVWAGGAGRFSGSASNAYESDVPTYSPSSTRDTASQINVVAGQETTNVDIRYRGDAGHSVSGIVGPQTIPPLAFNIVLTSTADGGPQSTTFQPPSNPGFVFNGVADGDYLVTAQSVSPTGDSSLSESRQVRVRGADITGIELNIRPLGSITGHVVLEESKAVECKDKRRPLFTETLIAAWHNEKNVLKDQPSFVWGMGGPSYPDEHGDFSLRNLAPGQYRFVAQFFAKYWYLKSVSRPPSTTEKSSAENPTIDAARNWTTLKPADRISGVTITLAEGAASLHGQVTPGAGTERVPAGLFVYLIPAERERSEDVLRFFAAAVSPEGKFVLDNVAPGRYSILAQPVSDVVVSPLSKLRLPDEIETRAKLRRLSEAAKTEIELKPCQNVSEYQLPVKPFLP
jgi:hypothetical protein